jgi:AcrR family transcriptional regulator
VSSSAPVRAGYHHGDLRNALIGAAAELAQAGGPASVTIRAAARAVGVTPTAAYRHFAGHEELLEAAKKQALDRLNEAMGEQLRRLPETDDQVRRAVWTLAAIGRGYLAFVQAEPGLFRTAFAQGMATMPPVEAQDEAGPFRNLVAAMDELVEVGYLPAQRRPMAELAAWSAVHGLAMLHLDGPLRLSDAESRQRAMERTLEVVMEGLGGRRLPEDLRAELAAIARGDL